MYSVSESSYFAMFIINRLRFVCFNSPDFHVGTLKGLEMSSRSAFCSLPHARVTYLCSSALYIYKNDLVNMYMIV